MQQFMTGFTAAPVVSCMQRLTLCLQEHHHSAQMHPEGGSAKHMSRFASLCLQERECGS